MAENKKYWTGFEDLANTEIAQKLKENGSLEEADKLLALYNDIPYLDEKVEIDPVNTLANFLYFKIKQEIFAYEKEIRTNPLVRKTEVLQETFGDYD